MTRGIKTKRTSGINAQTSINLIALVFVNGISFFATPIISDMIGTEGFGICSIYITYVNLFSIICTLQVGSSINTAKIKFENDFPSFCSNILILGLGIALLFVLPVIVLRRSIGALIDLEPSFVICIAIQGVSLSIIGIFNLIQINEKKAQRNLFLSLLLVVSTTLLSVLLINLLEGDYFGYIYGLFFPNILIGLFCLFFVFRRARPRMNNRHFKYALLFGIPVVFQDLSNIVLNQADRVMLQKSINFSQAGIYSLGVTFAHVTIIIYQAINRSWIPFYYEDLKEKKRDLIVSRAKSSMFNMTCICIGFILVSKEFFILYAPEEYESAIKVIPVLAFGCFMQYLYFFPVNHELYHSNTVMVATGTVTASAVNILLNTLLIPKYGMMGACLATAFSYVALFGFHEFICRTKYPDSYYISISMNVQCIATVFLGYSFYYFFIDVWIMRWLLAVVIGLILLYRIAKRKGLF